MASYYHWRQKQGPRFILVELLVCLFLCIVSFYVGKRIGWKWGYTQGQIHFANGYVQPGALRNKDGSMEVVGGGGGDVETTHKP